VDDAILPLIEMEQKEKARNEMIDNMLNQADSIFQKAVAKIFDESKVVS
jgi:hypothetical protein